MLHSPDPFYINDRQLFGQWEVPIYPIEFALLEHDPALLKRFLDAGADPNVDIGGGWTEELHEAAGSAMLALVFIHIGAVILSSLIHRENLVRSMVTGLKRGEALQAIRRPRWIAAGALVLAVTAFWTAGVQGALPDLVQSGPVAQHHEEDDD